MEFDWDLDKAASNLRKHGVTFVDASYVFDDLQAIDEFDEFNSTNENRYIIIGMCRGFILHVVYTEREERTV